jgi:hypothetical protein
MPSTPKVLAPFAERCITEQYLPAHFERLINTKMSQLKRSGKKVQIDLNDLYMWRQIPDNALIMLRESVFNKAKLNPFLAEDLEKGAYKTLMANAQEEYKHQQKMVKKGLRKHIQVDYNVLYC